MLEKWGLNWVSKMGGSDASRVDSPVQETLIHHSLGIGADLFDVSGVLAQDSAYKEIVSPYAEPRLTLRVLLGGSDDVILPEVGQEQTYAAGQCGVLGSTESHSYCRPRPGPPVDMVCCILSASRLQGYLGDMATPTAILPLLDGRNSYFNLTPAATAMIQRAALAIRSVPYQGASRHLFLQAKMLEILSGALTCLDERPSFDDRVLGIERRRLLEIRELLMASVADPPGLEQLARMAGSSPHRLNDAFRQEFGQTVFEWFADWKLNYAYQLLQAGEMPVKVIAHYLGYAHVSNFTTAFRRRFGTPPARLRTGWTADIDASA